MTAEPSRADLDRYREYLQEEVDGIYTYETLAELAEEGELRGIYIKLIATEQKHLKLWQEQLTAAGADATPGPVSRRARFLMWLARRFGPGLVLPMIRNFEADAGEMYTGDPIAEAAGLPADEASHARIFGALAETPGGVSGSTIGSVELRHRSLGGSNALRASVLGANDGLVSNLALVMGVAGADPGQATVILVGVAGLLAGSFSMALGEWVSVTSSREAAEAQLAIEREEIELMPEAEQEELSLIYQAKGLPEAEAQSLAAQIMSDPETALATLAREELGLVPEDLGSPSTAAFASFLLFSIGAILPVLPFLVSDATGAIVASAVLSAAGLFLLGASITLLTGRSAGYSGLRQVALGIAAAVITFGIGTLVGNVAGI
ncbi:MAG: VIT1/CCC1 transporter family protein [Dehalococcoidia bacterium]|jgi:VIT1/CCC1 family predicted Fe2+/Mn2+ transporter|nr:VIT1/CCC1 transporter family protein [Dehalococcoidia bacterium]